MLHLLWLASGGSNWSAVAQAELSGNITLGGTAGTFSQSIDLKNGRDVVRFDAGPIRGTQANLTDASWEADAAGIVTVHDGPGARVDAIDASFQDRNGWFNAPADELEFLGDRTEKGSSFELVAVTPSGGRRMVLWIGATDHLLWRLDTEGADHFTSSLFFADYRTIQGVLFPLSIRESNGNPSQDSVQVATTVRFSSSVDDAKFRVPGSTFKDAHWLAAQNSAQVPFTMADGRIVVNVSINGGAFLPFLLDTGAEALITPHASQMLKLRGSGDVGLSGVGSVQEPARFTRVKNLRIGPAEMSDQQFVIAALPAFLEDRGKEQPIAGLIGYEFLRRFPTTFDYQKKLLVLYKPGSDVPPLPGAQRSRLYFDAHTPLIKVGIDDATGYFGIDTGDNSVPTIFGPFYKSNRLPVEQPVQKKSEHGFGGSNAAILTRVGSLSIGSWTVKHPLVNVTFAGTGLFSDDVLAGNLGRQTLEKFVFTLDYEHHRGYFVKSADFGTPTQYNRSGMTLQREKDGSVTIERVNPNTPAAAAGLKPGDVILSINGQSPDGQGLSDFESVLSGAAGTRLDIKYRRADKPMRVDLKLAELLPLGGVMQPYVSN